MLLSLLLGNVYDDHGDYVNDSEEIIMKMLMMMMMMMMMMIVNINFSRLFSTSRFKKISNGK